MKVNNETGEVLEETVSEEVKEETKKKTKKTLPEFKKCLDFNGFYSPKAIKPLDLSNKKQEQFEEIPPFTKDADGKWLNDTSQPKLISKGYFDVDEYINSFKDDVDIYKLLEKIALTGDESLLYQKEGWYGDSTVFPDNIHDAISSFDDHVAVMEKYFTKDEISAIVKGEASVEDIVAQVNERINGNKKDVTTTSKEEVVKTEEKKEVEEK